MMAAVIAAAILAFVPVIGLVIAVSVLSGRIADSEERILAALQPTTDDEPEQISVPPPQFGRHAVEWQQATRNFAPVHGKDTA